MTQVYLDMEMHAQKEKACHSDGTTVSRMPCLQGTGSLG